MDQNSSSGQIRRFDKELSKDLNDFHLPENMWVHARNAINNSKTGDLGKLGNEPSNDYCTESPFTIIGRIHLTSDKWVLFSTNDIDSEIGYFEESSCTYTKIVRSTCLNFKRTNLISGVSKPKSTCNFQLYWDDGLNPTRTITITIDPVSDNYYTNPNSPLPWDQVCVNLTGCQQCTNKNTLDCDKLRLANFIDIPCIQINKGVQGGTLLNGSYQIALAYSINGTKISDWYLSNIQPVFQHMNGGNSIDVVISGMDQRYDDVLIAIISVTNNQTAIRLAGTYNTRQTQLSFDTIDNQWASIPIEEIPIMTPIIDKTDALYNVNEYLIRVGPTSKEDFNYQPLANQITAKWKAVEYPTGYYRKGGNKTNYLRDEVYAFFIRWVYDTGDKSSSYHIPGRPLRKGIEDQNVANCDANIEITEGLSHKIWEVYNTAYLTAPQNQLLADGGKVIAEGYMGYWESTEHYPDNKPEVWNSNITNSASAGVYNYSSASDYDLCGKPIRHHKFPDMFLLSEDALWMDPTDSLQYLSADKTKIRILGVDFENIAYPIDNNGNHIAGIVGFEILRGTRNGNKTILAKGLVSNMRRYKRPDNSGQWNAFPNYPYNDLRADPFLSTTETSFDGGSSSGNPTNELNYQAMNSYYRDLFTFHSPDTNFTNPFLSAKEFKVHGEMWGNVRGKFEISEEHPKQKLLTNKAFVVSLLAGVGVASLAMIPERRTDYIQPSTTTSSMFFAGPAGGGVSPSLAALPSIVGISGAMLAQLAAADIGASPSVSLMGSFGGVDTMSTFTQLAHDAMTAGSAITAITGANTTSQRNDSFGETDFDRIPLLLRTLQAVPMFFSYLSRGTDSVLELMKALTSYKDFALRYHSHAYYNQYIKPSFGSIRRSIKNLEYIGPQITDFDTTRINNTYRANTVGVQIGLCNPSDTTEKIIPSKQDVTRILASDVEDLKDGGKLKKPNKKEFGPESNFSSDLNGLQPQIASSCFVSLKQRLRNQYGQLNTISQFPISCSIKALKGKKNKTGVLFGGDTYLGRYTEKNTFFFFYDWLYGQPDGAEFDYSKHEMIPYPRFWANFEEFETGDFVASLNTSLFSSNPGAGSQVDQGFINSLLLPNDYYNLDGYSVTGNDKRKFSVKNGWFYLFSSGVKDFWVESEINIDLRDWGELESEKHYDPYRYTDTKSLFRTDLIKVGNYYKYDFSLSISRLWNNYISWGNIQPLSYNPTLAETCFVHQPKRLIYSLPAQFESLKDSWRLFLPNNYKDFISKVTTIKSINKSGALIFFENDSPIAFQGVDQLQSENGVKFTIGDGGLFNQPLQNLVNSDKAYQYASCQNKESVINTPAGIFWISQNQGKIFSYAEGINEISNQSLKWWLTNFLPYRLTQEYPEYDLVDNPVIGIGCQSIYDNENGLLYFTKRDFITKKLPPGSSLKYDKDGIFILYLNGIPTVSVLAGDNRYFEDVSWTLSYDPKSKGWVSFHDWHPNLMIPGKNTFMTIQDNTIWKHNERFDSYCNFYGIDYPFEVEVMFNTPQQVTTLKNIEYYLECYKYAPNGQDRYHSLDFNFDELVVYNTEQCSGLLKLSPMPKNDPFAILNYPIINIDNINVLYSKEENKYRIDQFWDITDDRGEFSTAERTIWNTEANGYIRNLNINNLNYFKDPFQKKKFRHYTTSVLFRKNVSNDKKMLFLFADIKNLISPR